MTEIETLQNAKFAQDDRINIITLGMDGVQTDPQIMWSRVHYHDAEIYDLKQRVHNLQESVDAIPRGWHRAVGLNTFMLVVTPLVICFLAFLFSLFK